MSKRVLRVNKLIKEELGRIILQEIEFPKKNLATITRVEVSPNLIQAFVYVSCLGEEKEMALKILERNVYGLQKRLDKKLKIRPIPKIIFKIERETEKAARIEELLEKIKEK